MYTLVASVRNHGGDPRAYLKDIIDRLPLCKANDEAALQELLPGPWVTAFKKRREQNQDPRTTNAA